MINKGHIMNEISMNTKYKPWKYAVRMTRAYVETYIEKIKNIYPFQDGIPTLRHGDLTSTFGYKVAGDIYSYGRHYHEDKMPGGHVDNYISSQIVYEYFANIVADDSPVYWLPCDGSVDIEFSNKFDGTYTKSYAIEVPYESGGKSEVFPTGYIVWSTKEEEAFAKNKLGVDTDDYKNNIENLESYFTEFLKMADAITEKEDKEKYDEYEYEANMP